MHRYGKVITQYDRFPGRGHNLTEQASRWLFVDEAGEEVPVEVVESAGAPDKTGTVFTG